MANIKSIEVTLDDGRKFRADGESYSWACEGCAFVDNPDMPNCRGICWTIEDNDRYLFKEVKDNG